jgi:hypothetical protein
MCREPSIDAAGSRRWSAVTTTAVCLAKAIADIGVLFMDRHEEPSF